eukprot:TRINITY_DN434_c0_g1_i1.p4 TRINITY_DN434_c0_g1~~TRINITY_DN434_c0_g1_i1.p4  ORF type:complete len:117 (+),score=77.83 TRINITY_DN434_c0_g1_i1:610-960(+)
MSTFDIVELATQLVELRKQKKSAEAVERFVLETTVMETPAMFGSDTFKGKAKILKKWKEQDKDGMKIVKEEPFKVVKPGVVSRKVTAEVLVFNLTVQHTIHFNATGKIDKMTVKKL